jgi:outer membrane murein-binding lipoprotein Lpp
MFQNPELVHEIAQLRKEVEALRRDNFAGHSQIAKNTGRLASLARKQDIEGTPPVREGA